MTQLFILRQQKPTSSSCKCIIKLLISYHWQRLSPIAYFNSARAGKEKNELSYAEAARWLVHIVGYDDCALKKSTAYKEMERQTNKDSESPGEGWLGKLGVVYAEGSNLFETLMLNLVVLKNGEDEIWAKEKPIWEQDAFHVREREKVTPPDNQSELFTFTSRQVLLLREGNRVTGYYAVFGIYFDPGSDVEQMTLRRGWNERNQDSPYKPRKHDLSRFIWQEYASLFVQSEKDYRPGIVRWIARLKNIDDPLIERSKLIKFRTVGISYKSTQKSSVEQIACDSLTFYSDLLSELGASWQTRIVDEIERCSQLAYEVGRLAIDISKAAGGDADPAPAKEQLYYRFDEPFRKWLYGLDPKSNGADLQEKCLEWRENAQQIARKLGKEMIDGAGEIAFVGRYVLEKIKGKEVKKHYSAPEAYNWYLFNIRKIYK